ncbi:MAG: hypothetical protein K9M82_13295, partial [Deltaproteobacteria bacterium]|nr:hypothetical protein [Deltaproteobacteria bacterium]
MSSILKALKKVEDVHPEPRRTESWSHAFDSREAIRRQARRSRTVRTGLVVLCVVAVLGVGGWWLQGRGVQPGGGAADPAGKRPTESRGNEPAPPAEPRGSVRTASKPAPDRTAE